MAVLEKILISRCFLGEKVKYDGGDNPLSSHFIQQWQVEQRLIAICPEVCGGLPVPRAAAEITHSGVVKTQCGKDVSQAFQRGAEAALQLCKQHNIRFALLKESSPSCGSSTIYDGSFTGAKISGQGVTTALLRKNGVKVYAEVDIKLLALDLSP